MSTHFLFVTAKMPVDRVNHFLSTQKKVQTKKSGLENSIFFVVRNRSVPYEDFKEESTEPPVEDFDTGFINASDEDLWDMLASYREYESKLDHGSVIHEETIVVLDKQSEQEDTALMLYNAQGREAKWRVPFESVWPIISQLPFVEKESAYLESIDEDGVINLDKVDEKLGVK